MRALPVPTLSSVSFGGEKSRAPGDARVLDQELGRIGAPVADAVLRLGHSVALDRQLPVLDLGDALAELIELLVLVHRHPALERERHRGRRPLGQGVHHPLPQERALLEDRDGPSLERAFGLVGEARHAERVAVGVGNAAVGREEEQRLTRHLPGDQHDHRGALVRDRDRVGQDVARRAALDRDGSERA
jgi:hypothetical protein